MFGGESIKGFSFALMIGVLVGTYSSLFIATPLVVDFSRKTLKLMTYYHLLLDGISTGELFLFLIILFLGLKVYLKLHVPLVESNQIEMLLKKFKMTLKKQHLMTQL